MRRDDAMPRVPGRGRGRRAAPRPVEEHLPGMWCSAAMMMASVLSVTVTTPAERSDGAASPSSGYGSDFSCGDADDGADVREGRPVSPAGSGSSSSSSSSSSSYATWDAVEVSNGRWAAMGLLPYWSIWSPTNLDDGLLDELAMRQASGLSSGHPEKTQDDEGDEEDFEFMTWVTSPPHCQTVDWGQFSAWAPVPTPAEAEALAVAAAEAEAARREVAAKKKRERANKYGGRHVHKRWKE